MHGVGDGGYADGVRGMGVRANEDRHGKLVAWQRSNERGAFCAIIAAFCANDYPIRLIETADTERSSDLVRFV